MIYFVADFNLSQVVTSKKNTWSKRSNIIHLRYGLFNQ
jgi:hypothetical protein